MKSSPCRAAFLLLIFAKFYGLQAPDLLLCAESQRINAHLLDHCYKSIGAGGRKMLLQTYLFDEIEVGVEYLLRGVIAEYADEQGHDALDDQGVALSAEVDHSRLLTPIS